MDPPRPRPSCGFCAGRDRPRPPLLGVSACVPMRPPPPRNTDAAASSRARRLVRARRRGWAAGTGEAERARDARLQLRRLARADAGVRDRQGRQGRARADRRRLRGPAGRPPRRGRLVPLRGHDRRGRPGRAARRLRRAPALPAAVRQVVHRPSRPRQVAPRGGRLRAPAAHSHRPRRRRDLRRPERRPRGRQLHRGPRAAEPRDRDARRAEPSRASATRSASRRTSGSRTCRSVEGASDTSTEGAADSFARAQLARMRSADEQTYLHNVGTLLDGFDALAAGLRVVEGRKQVLYFSAGFDARVLVGQWGADQRTPERGRDARPALGGRQHGPLRRQPAARDAQQDHAQPVGGRHGGALDRRDRPRQRPLADPDRGQRDPRPRHHRTASRSASSPTRPAAGCSTTPTT